VGDESPVPSAGDPGAPAPRVARRSVVVVVLAALVLASGWWLDGVGARPPGPATAGPPTGAWFCPHGGSKGWRAWVVVTNPGRAASSVRLTSLDASGSSSPSTFTVRGERQVFRSIPAGTSEAATEIEYFGAWVGAATVVQTPGGALATERCQSAPQPQWFLPDATTAPGRTSYLVVMNPFDTNAEFDVAFRTERRTVTPGALTPEVLRPGRSVAIKVNTYVLGGPSEQTVTAEVHPIIGRVIAGAYGTTSSSLRAEDGQPEASALQLIPAAGYGSVGFLQIMNPGPKDARFTVTQLGPTSRRTVVTSTTTTLPAERAMTVPLTGFPDGSVEVSTRGGVPVAAALRLEGPGADEATVGAAGPPAFGWLVPAATPPSGGQETLVLMNPGTKAANVGLRLIGASGVVVSPTRSVPPGCVLLVPLSSLSLYGSQPLSVLVSSRYGIVAGAVTTTSDGTGFAAATGLPVPEKSASR
jgi:hypothetical protein